MNSNEWRRLSNSITSGGQPRVRQQRAQEVSMFHMSTTVVVGTQ